MGVDAALKLSGQDLYSRAITIIPGGTQLLTKRPEMFLPDQWPSYYAKAQGVETWSLDGKKYIDMSYCGIGACVLGFADPDVDEAVRAAIASGSMATLNCPEEVELAELLCEIHPWAHMVRYARCGGEAMAIAFVLRGPAPAATRWHSADTMAGMTGIWLPTLQTKKHSTGTCCRD